MPVHIMELSLNVSVVQPGSQNAATQQPQQSSGQDQHETLVDECVAQIVKILNDKKER